VIEINCHCGDVRLTLPRAPDEIKSCNCSICRMSGFQGIYYRAGEVVVTGDLDGYVRRDMDEPCMTMWRCRSCGILTHWTLLDEWPFDDFPKPDRMGVNARLLNAETIEGLPVQKTDGASA
jgi:hypothetical protein